jgi:hypothetical protein
MAPALSFVLSALLASYVAASPFETRKEELKKITLSRSFNSTKGFRIVDVDRARIASYKTKKGSSSGSSSSFPITNAADTYTTQVGVGTPPTYYTLLIDTGSSNTWVSYNFPAPLWLA